MITKLSFFIFFLYNTLLFSQVSGAYELKGKGDPGEIAVLIISENYMSTAVYNSISHDFIRSYGGQYKLDGNKIILNQEFDTKDTLGIGNEIVYTFSLKGDELSLSHSIHVLWKKIQEPKSILMGCWRITDRIGQDGTLSAMPQGDRKTLKIMSGNRFQWFAINPKTKQFSGTGGGTYTLINGKYTEKIEFFSRDKTRVGNELSFDATVEGIKWTHKGKSTTGNLVHEVWTKQ